MVSILFLYKSFYLFYIKVSNFKNKKQIIYPTKAQSSIYQRIDKKSEWIEKSEGIGLGAGFMLSVV